MMLRAAPTFTFIVSPGDTICGGGDQAADVKNLVRAGHTPQDIVIVGEIAPDDLEIGVICVALEIHCRRVPMIRQNEGLHSEPI